jgi:hypothetical protein
MTWSCQASEHDADHGEPDEGGYGARISLEIARQAAIAANPGPGARGRTVLTLVSDVHSEITSDENLM